MRDLNDKSSWMEHTSPLLIESHHRNERRVRGEERESFSCNYTEQRALHCQNFLHKTHKIILCQYFQSHCSVFLVLLRYSGEKFLLDFLLGGVGSSVENVRTRNLFYIKTLKTFYSATES